MLLGLGEQRQAGVWKAGCAFKSCRLVLVTVTQVKEEQALDIQWWFGRKGKKLKTKVTKGII